MTPRRLAKLSRAFGFLTRMHLITNKAASSVSYALTSHSIASRQNYRGSPSLAINHDIICDVTRNGLCFRFLHNVVTCLILNAYKTTRMQGIGKITCGLEIKTLDWTLLQTKKFHWRGPQVLVTVCLCLRVNSNPCLI